MGPRRTAIGTATTAFVAVALIVVGAIGIVALSSSTSSSSPVLVSSTGTHKVAFRQIGACSPSFWGVPWAVTIGNITKVQPSNAKLPISYLYGTTDKSLTEIDFFLRSGEYQYTVSPSGEYFMPTSGSFAVLGSDITIPITYTGTSCIATVGSPTSLGSPISIFSVVTANISIGGSPRTIAVNPNTARVYIADFFSDNLTVVDPASDSVVARITLPANDNNGIAIDYNTNIVYVLVEGGVAEINGTNNEVVGELPLDFGPGSLAYDPSTHIIYGSPETGNGSLVGADVRTGSTVLNVSLGYWANSVVVNPETHVVFAVGCNHEGPVCNSVVSAVNGTDGRILNTVPIGNYAYPRVTLNPVTDVAYVSGSAQLVALNGTTGKVVFDVNSLACGTFDSMAVDPLSNQLLAVSLAYDYVLAYNGASGTLVNMYSFPSSPQYISFNPSANEAYVTIGSQLLVFQNVAGTGHVNSALIGSGRNCPLP